MRTAKYNDFAILRILLFIILIVLAVFACKHFVKTPCEHVSNTNGLTVVEPTCTEDGYSFKICADCGEQYDDQILSATGHNPGKVTKENEKPHTETEGGSYDLVAYCTVCKEQVSKETVMVNGAHTVVIEERIQAEKEPTCTEDGYFELVKYCKGCDSVVSVEGITVDALGHEVVTTTENTVDPTCTESGSFEMVKTCSECETELSRTTQTVDPMGHDYEWELCFENGEFAVIGNCVAGECNHICDFETDSMYSYEIVLDKENSGELCSDEAKIYIAIIYRKGVEITRLNSTVFDTFAEHTIKTEDGKIVNISEFVQYDENGRKYYNISTYGIYLVYEKLDGMTAGQSKDAAWDEDGFAHGVFKCATCDAWVAVRVYNDLATNEQ